MGAFNRPQSRNEAILQNMLGANNVIGAPQSRIEELLIKILENGGGGGGGGGSLTSPLVASVDVGGIQSGNTYYAGASYETILRDMLSPLTSVDGERAYDAWQEGW